MNDGENNINAMPPSNEEREITQKSKKNMPKLTLGKGELLGISLAQLDEFNQKFFEFQSNLKAGEAHAHEELQSYMDSVSEALYIEEVAKLRRDNRLKAEQEWRIAEAVTEALTPRRWRGWFFRWKRNQAQVLTDEKVARICYQEYKRMQDELPKIGEPQQETEYAPYSVLLNEISELLPRRMRRKKRAAWDSLLIALELSYGSKAEEQKQTAAKLAEAEELLKQARERVSELEELTAQLIEESEEVTEAPEETDKEIKEEQSEESAEAQETPTNEEETPETATDGESEEPAEPADEDEEEGLYYGELLEGEEPDGGEE